MPSHLSNLSDQLQKLRQDLADLERDVAREASPSAQAKADLSERRQAIIEAIEDIGAALTVPDTVPLGPPLSHDALAADEGLAVMVGHQRASPGAPGASPPFPPNGRHEYGWNADLAQRILAVAQAHGVRCKIFTRDGMDIESAYVPVKQWRPKATVELHFNSADNVTAKGTLTVYGHERSRAWAKALQEGMVAVYGRQGHREDRGIHVPGPGSGYARGTKNVVQIHPSALIEPFFGHNATDARLGIDRKQQLAAAIVAAYARLFGGAGPAIPTTPVGTVAPSAGAALPESRLYAELRREYEAMTLTLPDLDPAVAASLKSITLAQWAEESGWGTSKLAEDHFNFAGMKALSEVSGILSQLSASKVWYQAHDGFDWYLRFAQLKDFIRGYWMFLDRSPYRGWREAARKSPHDFIRFIGRVWSNNNPGYAERVIRIERRLLESAERGPVPVIVSPGTSQASGAINQGAIPSDAALFRELVSRHFPADPDLGKVKAVVAAQWAVESNWGRSPLATQHLNFAGMAWSEALAGRAGRVPHPTTPEKGDFCRFLDLAAFAQGYLFLLDQDARFAGWRSSTGAAEDFIAFLARTWRPADPGYAQAVGLRARDLASPLAPPAGGQTAPSTQPAPQIDQPGFVIRLRRTHCERRRGKTFDRTVGAYQAFFNGRAIDGLAGVAYERQGPGDNSAVGKQAHRRIKAGVYALSTHSGERTNQSGVTLYKTLDFASTEAVGAAPRPSVRLLNTGARSGILFHPGSDYLWSIGCFNLSKPNPSGGSIDWRDSRKRVIDLIEGMRGTLGRNFPERNNAAIPDAFIIIEGEPGPAGSDDVLVARSVSAKEFGLRQLTALRTALESDVASQPAPSERYHLIATALTASAEAGEVESGLFELAIAGADNLAGLSDENGNRLWSPWVTACATAETLSDIGERESALARLAAIGRSLVDRRVPLDHRDGTHTPLVDAAIANSPFALGMLLDFGAQIDLHDRQGMTPLHAAAFYGSLDAVRHLLDRGADHDALSRAPASTPADAAASDAAEAVDPDALPAGLRAIDCARHGKSLAAGSEELLDALEAVISLLWGKEN